MLGALALVALWSSAASAQVRRYALLIGANEGEPDDEPLRFAERDAQRMAEVLGKHGDVPIENLVLLRGPDADEVTRVVQTLNERINAADQELGGESLLFIYYSGHADVTAMHLGGTLLHFDRLRKMLKSSPAQLRVMVIDACRSGGLTRVKGARPVAPFKIDASGQLDGEGIAIITSSAASEDALESQRLEGSFFTHYFVTGLLGAADVSGDRRVTLTEAYRYAYAETLRATSRASAVQHPTYSFQMSGRDDLILTLLDRDVRGFGRLVLPRAGSYVFFQGDEDGALMAELTVADSAEITLPRGEYLVRRRVGQEVYEVDARVESGKATTLSGDMRRVPPGEMVRKGMNPQEGLAWGLSAGVVATGELLPGVGPGVGGQAGLQLDLDSVTLKLDLQYSTSGSSNPSLQLDQELLGADLTVLKLLDWWDMSLGFGVLVGGAMVRQRFDSTGVAPERTSVLGRGGATLRATWAAQPWLSVYLDGTASAWFVRREGGGGDVGLEPRLVPSGSAGLIFFVP